MDVHFLTTIPHAMLAGKYPSHHKRRQREETVYNEAAPCRRGSFDFKRFSYKNRTRGMEKSPHGGRTSTLQRRAGDRLQKIEQEGATGKRVAPFFIYSGRDGGVK
jgi:hypothetical protein